MTQSAREYVLEPIRDGAEFTLYRARQRGNPMPLLVVAPTMEPPPPQSLRHLEHEYSLADELEPAWPVKPLALTRYEGRTILVLADPGGEPLNRVLERDRDAISGTMKFVRGARSGAYMQLNDATSRRFGWCGRGHYQGSPAVHSSRYTGQCRLLSRPFMLTVFSRPSVNRLESEGL